MKNKHIFLILLVTLVSLNTHSTPITSYFFNQIGIEEGLVNSSITKVFQDSYGYIWIGTRGGLHRYDGYEIKVLRNIPDDINSLADNFIFDILEDSDRNIWVITSTKAHKIIQSTLKVKRYDAEQSKYMHCALKSKNGDLLMVGERTTYIYDNEEDVLRPLVILPTELFHSNVKSIVEDKAGNTYWLTSHSGLFVLNAERQLIKHYLHSSVDSSSLIKGALTKLFIDTDQRLWVTSETSGLCYLDASRDCFVRLNAENSALASNIVRDIVQVDANRLLIGTYKGLCSVNTDDMHVSAYQFQSGTPGSLSYYSIHVLYKDNTNGLWVGTWSGLNYYNELRNQHYYIKPREFSGIVGMGKEDSSGNIWFATEGAGLMKYDPKTKKQSIYPIVKPCESNLGANIIKSICMGGDKIYCATNKGVVLAFDMRTQSYKQLFDFAHGDIYDLFLDHDGRLWIPTNTSKGLVMVNENQLTDKFQVDDDKRRFNYIKIIKQLSSSVFVFASLTNQLYLYDMQATTLKKINFHDEAFKRIDNPRNISSITIDDSDNIWVAFYGSGIYKFSKELVLLKHYAASDGLADGYISSLLFDNSKRLWAHTGNYLYLYDADNDYFNTFHNVNRQRIEFSYNAGISDSSGALYFPGNKNILCFNGFNESDCSSEKEVIISSLLVNNQVVNIDSDEPLILEADQKNLTIEYISPDYVSPDQNIYAFKMDGIDADWNYVGDRRLAYYNNLLPGGYTFRVRVGNHNNWSNKETVLHIKMKPIIYRTWWAYTLYFIIVVTIVWRFLYLLKLKYKLENNIKIEQIEQDKIKQIHEERMRLYVNLSHELRTPLTLLINPIGDLLQKHNFSTEVKATLSLINKNAQRLMLLINKLMDIQKYNSCGLKLNKTEFVLFDFIQEMHKTFTTLAASRNIDFKYCYELSPNYIAAIDQPEFEKVIFNLLSNAFKFTPNGGSITITVSEVCGEIDKLRHRINAKANSGAVEYLHITISDSGKGISPDLLDKIFEPFYSGLTDLHQQVPGTGIGLALAREVVELHDGAIWAESEPDNGTELHILLPAISKVDYNNDEERIAKMGIDIKPIVHGVNVAANDDRATILIVDDNKEIIEYLTAQLQDQYKIMIADNGDTALKAIAKRVPHLVISDIMMPVKNGLELCRSIKENNQLMHIPIILLTGRNMPTNITDGYNVGADDYIIKPFEISILKSRIHNLLVSREKIENNYKRKLNLESCGIEVSKGDEDFLQQYTAIIQSNFANSNLDVNVICAELGMSRAKLYRKAKLSTNLSPAEMIKLLRLEASAQMLRETDLSIIEIIERIGFTNSGYFASCFKTKYGVLPKEYRANKKTMSI